jgi:hypothetical protein
MLERVSQAFWTKATIYLKEDNKQGKHIIDGI